MTAVVPTGRMNRWRSSPTRRWSNARSAARFNGRGCCSAARVYTPGPALISPRSTNFRDGPHAPGPAFGRVNSKALTGNALPGETQGLSRDAEREAAEFVSQVAAIRRGERDFNQSTGGEAGNCRMRIAIVNDDMPFLVDWSRTQSWRGSSRSTVCFTWSSA